MNKKRSLILNKKIFVSIFTGLLIGLFLINSGFAQSTSRSAGAGIGSMVKIFADALDSVVKEAEPALVTLFGQGQPGATLTSEFVFAMLLFFIIIFCIIWISLNSISFFQDKGGYLFFINLAASLLAVRFLSTPEILAIIMPYHALGITISAGVPFVIYWIIVEIGLKEQPSGVRKIAWIFFGVVMLGLFISRYGPVQDASGGLSTAEGGIDWADMYLVTAFLSFIMLIFDGTINRWYRKIGMDRELGSQDYVMYAKLNKEREFFNDALIQARRENDDPKVAQMKKRLKALEKAMFELRTRKY